MNDAVQTPDRRAAWWTGICFALLVLSVTFQSVDNGDLGFHLAAGRQIVESHSIPATDSFSYLTAGGRWINFEWLYDVAAFVVWSAWGSAGIVLVHALLYGVLFWILGLWLWKSGAAELWCGLGLLLAVLACEVRLTARPHVVEGIFVVLFLQRMLRYRRDPRATLWPLIPLQVIWTNLHGSHALGVLLSALLLLDHLVGRRPLRGPGVLAGGLILASLVNPFGWRQMVLLASHWLSATRSVTNPEWMPLRMTPGLLFDPGFWAFVLLAVAASFIHWRKLSGVGLFEWGALCFALFSPFALHARLISTSALILVLLMGHAWQSAPMPPFVYQRRFALLLRPVVLILAFLFFTNAYRVWFERPARAGAGVNPGTPGWGAGMYLAQFAEPGPVFNSYGAGGWLAWWLGPSGSQVFLDGRDVGNVYHPMHILAYRRILSSPEAFEEARARHDFQAVVLEHANPLYQDLARRLLQSPDWRLGYLDEANLVFLPASLIATARLRETEAARGIPVASAAGFRLAAHEPDPRSRWCMALSRLDRFEDATAGLAQALNADPRDADALAYMGTWHLMNNRIAEAIELLYRSLRINGQNGAAHQNLAIALLKNGNLPGALKHGKWAARWRPSDPQAWLNLAQYYAAAGRAKDAARCQARASRLVSP